MAPRDDSSAAALDALVAWTTSDAAREVPAAVLARAARVLADDASAMIGARDEPEVAAFHARVLARAGRPEATIFRGGRDRTDRLNAAVANAVAGDWLELDEGYRITPCHAGLYVVPALMAEAEARDLPLREVLRALVIAYEIVTRVARAFPPRELNVHSHARYAAVGACAATALARGLSGAELRSALTAAATLINVGPRNHLVSGALVRNVWPAMGAWAGMMSVEWAACGIGGAADGLSDVYAGVLGSTPRPEAFTQGLGEQYAILDGYLKLYACCQHLHSAVEATLDALPRVVDHGGPDRVTRIEVDAHPLAQLLPNAHPTTTLGAKFSLPHALAAVLVTGTGGADAFAYATLHDPAIGRLRERVQMLPYAPLPAPPHDRPARVRLHLADGAVVEAACESARGGADRPFPPEMFARKIAALAGAACPRFAAVTAEAIALAPARLAQGFASFVTDWCS